MERGFEQASGLLGSSKPVRWDALVGGVNRGSYTTPPRARAFKPLTAPRRMQVRVAWPILSVLALALAGCASIDEGFGDPNEPADGRTPVSSDAYVASLEPIDCPDVVVVAELPRDELEPFVPDGYEIGDSQDFFLGLSPFADFQQHSRTGPYGALVLFIQQCQGDIGFEEGYTSLFVEPPEHSLDIQDTGLNFVALEHAVQSEWLTEASQQTGWDLDVSGTTRVDQSLGDTGRSASVSWSNASTELASVEATAPPAHPPIEYDVVARVWQAVDQGVVVYDHAAAGNMYPADQFTCEISPDSEFGNITGRTDCDGDYATEAFSAYILQGHDPLLTVNFFPDT